MPIHGFNHLNIRTPEFDRTVRFFIDALGMTLSPVPGHGSTDNAAWLLDEGGTALFHVARSDVPYSPTEVLPDPPLRASGAIHHVALTCTDLKGMRDRLRGLNIDVRENSPGPEMSQIFVLDPSGISFELNFRHGPLQTQD
jgi:catechol 2,3-dioxygenase-like lactoylglutathione lyase family enzyme